MQKFDIWFSTLKLSNKIKLRLLKTYNTTEKVWEEFNSCNAVISEISNKIKGSFNKIEIEDIESMMVKKNIKLSLYNDNNYPKKLRDIDDAPAVLFYIGDIKKLNDGINVAIVGSRNCTNYGKDVTRIVSAELSKHNIGIISGMARGIDTYAHYAALENNGLTAAVLGCGIDVIYPPENAKLYKEITTKGCILSEFLPGTEPFSYNFPTRNRIISGLSNIVIIIEAGIKSGSLITATLALEQGKDVFAVPGQIFSSQSKGTNKLIKDGAYPLTSMEDVFEILSMNYISSIERSHKKINPFEEKICNVISDTPIHIDDIIKTTSIDIKRLYELLFDLQLKNEILCLAGNYYVKINNII